MYSLCRFNEVQRKGEMALFWVALFSPPVILSNRKTRQPPDLQSSYLLLSETKDEDVNPCLQCFYKSVRGPDAFQLVCIS